MIWHHLFQKVEPKEGNLGQDPPLVGNSCSQYVVESGNAVRRNKKQVVAAHLIHIADLAAGKKLQIGEVSL